MKILQNLPTLTKAIIIAGMLGACQNEKDAVVTPAAEDAQNAGYKNAKISADSKLIKDGKVKLEYSGPRNLLTKETHEEGNYFIEYIYSSQAIKATCYDLTTKMQIKTATFILNSSGLCAETIFGVGYNSVGTLIHEYNDHGQLIKSYNKMAPSERQEFKYINSSDGKTKWLTAVEFYDKNNYKTSEIIYTYMGAKHDFYPINHASTAYGTGKYLSIFGTPITHLPTAMTEKQHKYKPYKCVTTPNELSYDFYVNGRVKLITKNGDTYSAQERIYSTTMASN
ncbi:hypothetical protein [Dyadobacter chenhuakuii]|uniref:DUF4595 domain-containing protein n=1 Tax=Dyadobacter chenhuakuii TaxID=2909339 RepID=A0A9X1QKN5_9BACT|nr:hypothetical protein [Dyadobacter chenhuakuii]MCF2491726.1 hypothetical protein [Dyadobacter chenhuakuii]MCF2501424.1 hypothetical protein [Dyadobacter chenhuakuii]USJ29110.1 hypothetical protein NFI80_14625 [Dyadobacter chenhuakuii]